MLANGEGGESRRLLTLSGFGKGGGGGDGRKQQGAGGRKLHVKVGVGWTEMIGPKMF